jgi:hypothetical protein
VQGQEYLWHSEVITPAVEGVIYELYKKEVVRGLYLAGGTGLALHLGHRRSVDLDLFSAETLESEVILQRAQKLSGFSLLTMTEGSLQSEIRSVKVSFLSYVYPVLFPLRIFQGMNVADPRDIACMKISAIAGRGTKRDFIDLYSVAELYDLRQLLDWFKQKYVRTNYSIVHILKSLTYFEDAEQDPSPDMLVSLNWGKVKRYFLDQVPAMLE